MYFRKYLKTPVNINSGLIIIPTSEILSTKFEQPKSIFYSSFHNALLSNNPKPNKRKLKQSETTISRSLPTLERAKKFYKQCTRFNCFRTTSSLAGRFGVPLCLNFILAVNKRSKLEEYTGIEKSNCFRSIIPSPISYFRRAQNYLIDYIGFKMDKTPENLSQTQTPSVREVDMRGRQLFSSPIEILADLREVPLNIFEDDPEIPPQETSEQSQDEFSNTPLLEYLIPEVVINAENSPLILTQVTEVLSQEIKEPEVTVEAVPEIKVEIIPEIKPEPVTESPEPILDVLQREVVPGEPSPPGVMSSSSNSDILIEPIFGEAPYYIPNKCQKVCSFEYQVHPEPSTSRKLAPKVIIKRRCTRKVTREEEIKKENYRKFQEEMDKIEVVTEPGKKKRVATKSPKSKAKKDSKKAPTKIIRKKRPEPKQPEQKKKVEPPKPAPKPKPKAKPKRISKRKQANPKKITQ